jgi:uncharacterized membrane protein YhaH (DUF805 family)
MSWFLAALSKYADFSGRARRSEYWYFFLFYLLIYFGLIIASTMLGRIGAILTLVFLLAMLIPSLSVGVRRLHDTDRSGWWLLISLIPLVGAIILIVFAVQDSDPGENRFGSNPKEEAEAAA